jgi:ribosomal protein S18 acetylase RimI-like enzyme
MTLIIRPMREDDAPNVVAMVQGLARDTGSDVVPRLTPESLIAARDLIDVTIAEDGGAVLGACLTLLTYSTWRDAKGLYVVDLFIDGKARNRGIGLKLLREAGRRGRAKGARFIKLEVNHTNDGAARFYERLGFVRSDKDRLFLLEDDRVTAFLSAE